MYREEPETAQAGLLHHNRPHRLFVYGVPGSGKTTLTRLLASRSGFTLVEADCLRDAMPAGKRSRFATAGTSEAWSSFGPLNRSTLLKGLAAVRAAMRDEVEAEIERHAGPLILEAAFLDPAALRGSGRILLLTVQDEKTHRRQYLQHRDKKPEGFAAVRLLQEILVDEARRSGIPVLVNRGDPSTHYHAGRVGQV